MRQRGFTYLGVLLLVAIMGAVLAATATVWHTLAQRDKERELLYIGHEFRAAIGLYYERTPGSAKQFPKKLEDLLEDKRQTNLARYLRKRYLDPLTASKEWGLVAGPGETVMGVYSLSQATPIKSGNFDDADKNFEGANSYQDWKFVYAPKLSVAAPVPPTVAPPPVTAVQPSSASVAPSPSISPPLPQ